MNPTTPAPALRTALFRVTRQWQPLECSALRWWPPECCAPDKRAARLAQATAATRVRLRHRQTADRKPRTSADAPRTVPCELRSTARHRPGHPSEGLRTPCNRTRVLFRLASDHLG